MALNSLDELAASAANRFRQRNGHTPRWIVAAPGRVNLIGEHIDYNDGFVLPMAIDRYCVIAAANQPGEKATVYSVATDDEAVIPLSGKGATDSASAESGRKNTGNVSGIPASGHWSSYVAGVIAGFAERNLQPGGFSAVIESSVPFGGGLSSSAAIEVATAMLIEAITGTCLHPVEKALLCQKAEHEYAGVPCGIMDPFASVMCRADDLMLLDCRSQRIEHVPFTDPAVTVLIINTNVRHALATGQYAERRAQCESAARKLGVGSLRDATVDALEANCQKLTKVEYRRAWHAIGEIARTVEAASAVKAGDWRQFGQLMYASHQSLRDDYEVSCRELDLAVDLAREIGPQSGVLGSRMTGGGFGGCTVSLVETANVGAIAESLAKAYRAQTGIEPSIIVSRPSRGAHIVKSGGRQ